MTSDLTTNPTTTSRLGFLAAGLTTVGGLIEVVVGSNGWTGDKNDPTTLGIFTIVLAAIMAVAAMVAGRASTVGSSLTAAVGLIVPALIAFTTAGLVAIPGAVVGVAAGGSAVAAAARRGPVRPAVAGAWPTVLIAVLAAIYLAFGIVAGWIGILGVTGAAAAIAALAIRYRSRGLAALVLLVGVAPFAVVAWWSVIVPLTAILLLAIELPLLRTGRRTRSAAGFDEQAEVSAERA